MSDYGAFAGAQMIAEYLSIRDFMNGLDRNRANAQLTVDNAFLHHEAEQLVARYNQLAAEFNDLLRRATEVAAEANRKDSVIAGLQQEAEQLRNGKAALEAECERLRRENTGQAIRIQWLSDMVREDRPATFRTVKLFAKTERMVDPNNGDPPCTARFSSRCSPFLSSPAAAGT